MFSSIPIARPTRQAIQNDVNRAKSAAVSAGTTWSGSACRVELRDRGGEHAEPAGDERREQRARQREPVRREPDQHRADLVLRGRPRREPEAGAAGRASESTSVASEDDPRQDEPVDRHVRAEHRDRAARQHRRLRLRPDPERERDGRLRDEQHAERGGELRERRGRSQRPEDRELDQQPDAQEEDAR